LSMQSLSQRALIEENARQNNLTSTLIAAFDVVNVAS
jgi:hypothetical protein